MSAPRPRATCLDTGAGNLHSLRRGLERIGLAVRVEPDFERALRDTELVVLPGVGAFGLAAARLAPGRELLVRAIDAGLPALGICLGMQLLFESSEEGPGAGLGLFKGRVTRLRAERVPHIGWTEVEGHGPMYFAHSFACRVERPELVSAWAVHEGDRFPAIVRAGRVAGVQFHPEKSSTGGLGLLGELVRGLLR